MIIAIFSTFFVATITGCSVTGNQHTEANVCSSDWYALVEQQVFTGDNHGHGPDLGSAEWRSVVEFKLGIREQAHIPPLDSNLWCRFINTNYIKKAK